FLFLSPGALVVRHQSKAGRIGRSANRVVRSYYDQNDLVNYYKSFAQRSTAMADFLFIYRGSGDAERNMSPDEMQKHMQQWGAWIGTAMQKGWMTNPGDALTPEGKVVKSQKVVTDGPFVEAKEVVGGYSVVKADSLAAAAELAKGCPAL